eukprot:CAMPEP_0172320822 /NCGR_PEP_ID=MMETSP1058-20130122/41543_1 /TAXON_ID=83371 /ORGANISM="Detonula confervacea, Strain CCMP 353" /LENGTH=85 /DNA_ID=CAMNT_0013036173 /DNA_START=119 /DNA_END=372 /DNA_ORIENTATION=-
MISRWRQRKAISTPQETNGHGATGSVNNGLSSPMYSPPTKSRKVYGGGPAGQSRYGNAHDHLQSPCNSFLLGGNVYAGADKRRRR